MGSDTIALLATNFAGKAYDDLINKLRDNVGESLKDANVRRVAEIGLSLSSQIGGEGIKIMRALIEGRNYDERVLADNLSLREMSDLLDVVQGLEAKQRAATMRILSATEDAAIEASSIMVKAFLAAI